MHRIVLAAMLVVGVLSTYPQGQTRAYLTSAVNGAGNTFTAGNIQIGAGIAVGDTLTMSNMVPGDSFLARLTIQNSGNITATDSMFLDNVAGGGTKAGHVHGATDKTAAYPKDHPVSAGDLAATVYHLLGVDPEATVPDQTGRPIHITHGGRVLERVLIG